MKFILGKKENMTRLFDEKTGLATPATIVVAGPCFVSQVKVKSSDGISAVQIVFDSKRRVSKPVLKHLKNSPANRFIREFRVKDDAEAAIFKVGDKITAEAFAEGDVVAVIGTSKGKGFQGVVKRHHFKGSPKTHGHKDQLRMPGSIGATAPQRVPKGRRMAGHMGTDRVTVKNLNVVKIDRDQNRIYINGAIPGARGSLIIIKGEGAMTPHHEEDKGALKETSVEPQEEVKTEVAAS